VTLACNRGRSVPAQPTAPGIERRAALPPPVRVTQGRHGDYYHLVLTLRPADFELTVGADERVPRYAGDNAYEFSPAGQFEIFVHQAAFPIAAPQCRRFIILRMPATDPSAPAAADKIAAKKRLFDALANLKQSNAGELSLAVELNPYVRVVRREPLEVELTQCNVFFRQRAGAYAAFP